MGSVVDLLRWWYGEGIVRQWLLTRQRIAATADYFSISLLIRTLFAPFRQISAGAVDGPLAVKWHAFVDKLISRCLGAVFRSLTIVAGVIALFASVIFAGLRLAGWLILPLAPLIGLALMMGGTTPWTQ